MQVRFTHNHAMRAFYDIFGTLGSGIQLTLAANREDRAQEKMDDVHEALTSMLNIVETLQSRHPKFNEQVPTIEVEDFEAAVLRDIGNIDSFLAEW